MIYECKPCDHTTEYKSNLNKHLLSEKHILKIEVENNKIKPEFIEPKIIEPVIVIDDQTHKCNHCDNLYSTNSNLVRHLKNCPIKKEKENEKGNELKHKLNDQKQHFDQKIMEEQFEKKIMEHDFASQRQHDQKLMEQKDRYDQKIIEQKLEYEEKIHVLKTQQQNDSHKHELIIANLNTSISASPTKINTVRQVFNNQSLILIQNQNEIWFKGSDIASILKYTKDKLINNIDDDAKIELKDLYIKWGSKIELQENNIYINECSVYHTICSDKTKHNNMVKTWLFSDILPKMRGYKTNSVITNENTKPSIYLTKNISDFHDKNVIYIACIGEHNNELLFKYGISSRIFIRDYTEHRKVFKVFKVFDVIYIKETDNNAKIETYFEENLKSKNIHRTLLLNKKKHTELFTVTSFYNIDKIFNILNDTIATNPLPIISNYTDKIKKLENDAELQKKDAEVELYKKEAALHKKEAELYKKDIKLYKKMQKKNKQLLN